MSLPASNSDSAPERGQVKTVQHVPSEWFTADVSMARLDRLCKAIRRSSNSSNEVLEKLGLGDGVEAIDCSMPFRGTI